MKIKNVEETYKLNDKIRKKKWDREEKVGRNNGHGK